MWVSGSWETDLQYSTIETDPLAFEKLQLYLKDWELSAELVFGAFHQLSYAWKQEK